ncbi:MAG: CRISPR-associated endoribonuclease Cas6 [Bacteroidota bacterium]
MRFQLTLTRQRGERLPLSYQYELSAWLYRVIQAASPEFSRFLHEQGYPLGNQETATKRFKLFTFSHLQIPTYRVEKEKGRLWVQSPDVQLQVSFCLEEAAEHFITGLFMNQRFALGDKQSQIDFMVTAVEALPRPVFTQTSSFRTLSPLCVSVSEERNGRLMPQYRSPEDPDFTACLLDNLINKYIALAQYQPAGASMSAQQEEPAMAFRLLSVPKEKKIVIKANTPEETKIRAYLFDFELQAPIPLLEFGYAAGFGEKNSTGFGCVAVKTRQVLETCRV